jgi:hypothetical protein
MMNACGLEERCFFDDYPDEAVRERAEEIAEGRMETWAKNAGQDAYDDAYEEGLRELKAQRLDADDLFEAKWSLHRQCKRAYAEAYDEYSNDEVWSELFDRAYKGFMKFGLTRGLDEYGLKELHLPEYEEL